MAWVFLAGDRVYKLKKPVRYPYLDFSTVEARCFACSEELRLNREITPEVYLGLRGLHRGSGGELNVSGTGSIVDWLVEMKRLPAELMLDELIHRNEVDLGQLGGAAKRLSAFYAQAACVPQSSGDILGRFQLEHAQDERILRNRSFEIDHHLVSRILGAMKRAFETVAPLIDERAAANVYLEGHGDLRPEHICLTSPPAFIDRLEFNRELRIVDPYDELTYLSLECGRLGSRDTGKRFFEACSEALKPRPPDALLSFYRASRCLLRARLSLAHLLDPDPRTPSKWEPRAQQYITIANDALLAFQAAATC